MMITHPIEMKKQKTVTFIPLLNQVFYNHPSLEKCNYDIETCETGNIKTQETNA